MNAVYKNRCYKTFGSDLNKVDLIELGTDNAIYGLSYGDEDLILDPTDDEWFACENAPAREPRQFDGTLDYNESRDK